MLWIIQYEYHYIYVYQNDGGHVICDNIITFNVEKNEIERVEQQKRRKKDFYYLTKKRFLWLKKKKDFCYFVTSPFTTWFHYTIYRQDKCTSNVPMESVHIGSQM